jgi:hypothetical protein
MRYRQWISSSRLHAIELRGLLAGDAAVLMQRTDAPIDRPVRQPLITEDQATRSRFSRPIATLTDAELRGKTLIANPLAGGYYLDRALRGSSTAFGATLERHFSGASRLLSLTPAELPVALIVAQATRQGRLPPSFSTEDGLRSRAALVRRVESPC